jgi:uncharacterized peroxidase-related enzyme
MTKASIAPLTLDQLPVETRQSLEFAQKLMGFVPNDALVMARWPELLRAMQQLVAVVYQPRHIEPGLKRLLALMVSAAAGCRYCQAHTAHGAAQKADVSAEKLAAVWQHATSPLFAPAERAALDFAFAAGQTPNTVSDAHFARLREYYSDDAILEITGVIALFGFLNRWNDTLATPLENVPLAFAATQLASQGWQPGKHQP